jgi:hypothetical protein
MHLHVGAVNGYHPQGPGEGHPRQHPADVLRCCPDRYDSGRMPVRFGQDRQARVAQCVRRQAACSTSGTRL